jgi:hypothetical protein
MLRLSSFSGLEDSFASCGVIAGCRSTSTSAGSSREPEQLGHLDLRPLAPCADPAQIGIIRFTIELAPGVIADSR